MVPQRRRSLLPLLVVLLLLPQQAFAQGGQSYDCMMKSAAMEFAQLVQPFRTQQDFQDIADALNGAPQYGSYDCAVAPLPLPANAALAEHGGRLPFYAGPLSLSLSPPRSASASTSFYIDPVGGDDGAAGTEASPFRTLYRGLAASRASSSPPSILVLRSTGLHFLSQGPLVLTPQDSGLTVTSYPGEKAWITGGTSLDGLVWTQAAANLPSFAALNVWSASLAHLNLTSAPTGLRDPTQNYRRLIRARFPNADPERDGFGSTLTPAWLAPDPFEPPTTWVAQDPKYARNDTANQVAQTFSIGYNVSAGSGCSFYQPPAGYFCGDQTTFGGLNGYPQWPKGLTLPLNQLPNAPYTTNLTGSAVVHAFRANHWFSRMHVVDAYDPTNVTAQRFLFDYGRGGFQGAEGTTADAEFYVENVFEELDAKGEWFYNASTQILYVAWNATGAPPADGLIATREMVYVNATSTQAAPITGLTFSNLGVRDQAITYFEPHGLPSGGDWALQRTGAFFFEGVEGATITGCSFDRMDGIAIFLSGYTRNVNISFNDFAWNGETVVALWGYGDGGPVPGMGPDLTAGNQPRYTTIAHNLAREFGVWQKQSSFVFQAVAGLSNIVGNIYYNGPRAGINFNDGSIGGSNITGGLGFNMCRESGDHGVHNSWDRIPYYSDTGVVTSSSSSSLAPSLAPSGSTTKLWDTHLHNFFIANYECMAAIDNDDVSGYYVAQSNFFSYSPFALKADFGGHDNRFHGNVLGYLAETSWFDGPAGVWCTWGNQNPGHELWFTNNTLVQDWCHDGPWPGAAYTCESNFTIGLTCSPGAGATVTGGNTYHLPLTNASYPVVYECGMPIAEYQASCPECDPGSVALPYPADEDLIALARSVLGMPPAGWWKSAGGA